jgi:2-polyprenyl-3-methyl-5-hydroxy-6-metoxy-1,4-benzoquinol methylase
MPSTKSNSHENRQSQPRRRRAPVDVLRRLEVVDLDLLGVKTGAHVLDAGCGVGRLMLRMARRGCRVTGVELMRRDLLSARHLLGGFCQQIDLIEGDGGRIPFAAESFDFVACTETLEHVADSGLALRELTRVLKPGGHLVVSVPDALPELIARQVSEFYRTDPWGHRRIFTRGSIAWAVEAVGLRVYARRQRNSVEAVYWTLLYLVDACPLLREWAVDALDRWRSRSNSEPYSLLYHVLDEAGNRVFPKSITVYAVKPR